jgi:hypothetical protein
MGLYAKSHGDWKGGGLTLEEKDQGLVRIVESAASQVANFCCLYPFLSQLGIVKAEAVRRLKATAVSNH